MGTVTAIGEYDPDRNQNGGFVTTTTSGVTATSINVNSCVYPSVAFDDWETAIKFAEVMARQHVGVKVRKVAGAWSVQWSETYLKALPVPWQPYQPLYPYVTYTSRSAS